MTSLAATTLRDETAIDGAPDRAITHRLASIDLLRGAVMVLMVLDHVRDYFSDIRIDPTDLAVTSPALFFTRWITHFCAPTFVFLAGTGAFLAGSKGKTKGQLAHFLITRGLWLIVLEQTWENLFFHFAFPKVVMAIILWAIGWSMIALAGLIFLPRAVIGAIGVGMIALHNLLDGVRFEGSGATSVLWHLLHQPGFLPLPGGYVLLAGYPLIPWIGVMAVGYAFGPVFLLSPERRRPIAIGLGLALTLGFVALRVTNLYGDPRPWSTQASPVYTLVSFLNCQKYPPSLLFLMMTLGPALLALAWLDRGASRWMAPVLTIGRVPLFFYLLQWPLIHGMAVLVASLRGQPIDWMFKFPPFQAPPGYGESLPMVYLMWIVALAILYPPCRWFADLKRRRRDAWLSYL